MATRRAGSAARTAERPDGVDKAAHEREIRREPEELAATTERLHRRAKLVMARLGAGGQSREWMSGYYQALQEAAYLGRGAALMAAARAVLEGSDA